MKTNTLNLPSLVAFLGSIAAIRREPSLVESQGIVNCSSRASTVCRISVGILSGVLLPGFLWAFDLDIQYLGIYRGSDPAYDVAVAGNYAYVAAGSAGFRVVDLSNRTNSTVGEYYSRGHASRLAVAGHYAYVAESGRWTGSNNLGGGLEVIDIINPANPQRVGALTNFDAGDIAVSGNYACVVAFTTGPTLQVIDISDPTNPQRVGGYDITGFARVTVVGNLAYVADYDAGLHVIDISNPARPQRVGGYRTSGSLVDVAVREGYAYVAEGVRWDGTNYIGKSGLAVIDLSDPTNPRRVGDYYYDDASHVTALSVAGNYACLMADGFRLIDLSDPFHPKLVGGTFGGLPNDDLNTLAFTGNFIYVPDYFQGLHVFEVRPALRLEPLRRTELGAFGLRLHGPHGVSIRVQRSTNLMEWENWQSVTLGAAPSELSDADAINVTRRFYRAVTP